MHTCRWVGPHQIPYMSHKPTSEGFSQALCSLDNTIDILVLFSNTNIFLLERMDVNGCIWQQVMHLGWLYRHPGYLLAQLHLEHHSTPCCIAVLWYFFRWRNWATFILFMVSNSVSIQNAITHRVQCNLNISTHGASYLWTRGNSHKVDFKWLWLYWM